MQQIATWLKSLGLGEYAQRFAENDIDVSVLRYLSDQDLEKLGVSLGHRRKMLAAIVELDGAIPTTPHAAAEPNRRGEAERRQLTVMFCDLVGSTALSARLDPEDMRAVIAAYHAACAGIMPTYDGFIAEFRGDGILAYFGYPRAHEDDAERAVRAGLDVIAAVERLKTRAAAPLAVRIGIATGLVVVGDLSGEGASGQHAAVGDTPNLAARLQAMADPGTIVIAAPTRRLLGDLFHLRDLGRHEVKGIAEPVAAWAVEGVSDSDSRFEAVRTARLTDLIGREDEISFLVERQRLAWKGKGQIVLIAGEPGIGKSRLAAALGERIAAEPHTRLRYQCSPYHTNSALYPFIAQLERAAEIKPDDPSGQKLDKREAVLAMGTSRVQAVAPLFAALLSIPFDERYPPLALSPTQQRRQTLAALLDQLEGLARQQPVLLFFEDAHWADATSLELLDLTVERVRQLPVLALFTFRSEFEPPWAGLPNVGTLALGRLDRADAQSMVARVTGGRPLPGEVTEQIIVKTDGVPLFVEELTKTVLEAGILVKDAEGYCLNGPLPPLAIPATLRDSLMARLDRLARVKEIAQIGSAIGREFSYSLLRVVAGREETALKHALAQLEAAALVFRRGEPPEAIYRFKHALVQDAAYESLLKSRRQVLHRRIAEILSERFPKIAETEPEVVAHHFTQAGLTEAAVEWWGKAGWQAMKRSAYSEAIAHLSKAVAIADELPGRRGGRLNRLHLQISYGRALRGGLGYSAPEAVAAWARAREFAADINDPGELAPIYLGLFNASLTHGEIAPMWQLAEAIMSAAKGRPESPGAALVAHWTSGLTCWFQGNYSGAKGHLEQALAIYRAERSPAIFKALTLDLPAAVMRYLGLVLWPLGEINRSRRLADQAVSGVEIKRPLVQANELVHKTVFDGLCGEHSRMMQQAETILALAREHGLPLYVAAGTYLSGLARWRAGDRLGGPGEMRRGWALLHENDCYLYEPFWGMQVAKADAEAGQIETGLANLSDLIIWAEQTGQHWLDAELHRVRGELLRVRDPPDVAAAEDAFKRAIDIARSQQTKTFELRAALSLAKLYEATGRGQVARELLVPALAGFNAAPEIPEVEEAQRLLTTHEPDRRADEVIE
jgi:class 3 adenylate cyclase/tetratricopeptide (TPR) repeat protein